MASNYSFPGNQYNVTADSFPVARTFGNVGRNTLRGPSVYNWDSSLFKTFRVGENKSREFRAETLNLFNTPQFSAPAAVLNAPASFGRSFSMTTATGGFGSNRHIQLALKLMF